MNTEAMKAATKTRSIAAGDNTIAGARKDPRYTVANIPTSTMAGLVRLAQERGYRMQRWFAGSGVHPQDTADPDARMSFRQIERILSRALDDVGECGLGLAVGNQTTIPGLGLLGLSLLSSRNLAEAAAVGQKYHPASGSLMDVSCHTEAGEFVLEAFERFPQPRLLPFLCEKLFASALATTRNLLGADYRPCRLELGYPAPDHAPHYQDLFLCPVHFSAGRNRMVTNPALLHRSLPTHSPSTHAETIRLVETRMSTVSSHDEVSGLRQWLRGNPDHPTVAEAAAALHLHERSLRRRLAAAGTSFRTLRDEERAKRATALLRETRISIGEIAVRLGFSDEREFRQAYKRWTGQLPSRAR